MSKTNFSCEFLVLRSGERQNRDKRFPQNIVIGVIRPSDLGCPRYDSISARWPFVSCEGSYVNCPDHTLSVSEQIISSVFPGGLRGKNLTLNSADRKQQRQGTFLSRLDWF